MRCSACQSENPAGKKFCGDCGAALGNWCRGCGADNPANRWCCGDCGAQLEGVTGLGGDGVRGSGTGPLTPHPLTPNPLSTRKVISIVFADLMGSTALHER